MRGLDRGERDIEVEILRLLSSDEGDDGLRAQAIARHIDAPLADVARVLGWLLEAGQVTLHNRLWGVA